MCTHNNTKEIEQLWHERIRPARAVTWYVERVLFFLSGLLGSDKF